MYVVEFYFGFKIISNLFNLPAYLLVILCLTHKNHIKYAMTYPLQLFDNTYEYYRLKSIVSCNPYYTQHLYNIYY